MRLPVALAALFLTLALSSCGNQGSPTEAPPKVAMSKAEVRSLEEPKVIPPDGPPPRKLVIRDIHKGSGVVVEPRDQVLVHYAAVNYRTGEVFETTWAENAYPRRLPLEDLIKGWQLGLPGMRVGGRRELIIPSRLAYETGALIYVVDVLEAKPNSRPVDARGLSDYPKALQPGRSYVALS